MQRKRKRPLKSYTPIVPKITSVKQKRMRMLSMEGSEFRRVRTRPRMPCKEFSVRRGLKILITRMADTFNSYADRENQPKITTVKSS